MTNIDVSLTIDGEETTATLRWLYTNGHYGAEGLAIPGDGGEGDWYLSPYGPSVFLNKEDR